MAKLKVFTWSDGFHAFTVATTSRPRALARRKTIKGLKAQILTLDDEFQIEADRIADQIAILNADREALERAHQKQKAALQLKLNAAREK